MKTKIDKFIGILIVFSFIVANTAFGFDNNEVKSINLFASNEVDFENPPDVPEIDEELLEPELTAEETLMKEKQDAFLRRLNDELNLSKVDYKQVLNSVSAVNQKLKLVSEERMSLEEQLTNLEANITSTTDKLFEIIRQVLEKEREVSLLYEQIELKEIALEYQKQLLKDYFRVIYQEENSYLSVDDSGELNAFKLLLADGSVGNHLKEMAFIDLLNEAGQQMADKLSSLTYELEYFENQLNTEKTSLIALQQTLEEEKKHLELQKESKESLLKLTKGQEDIYRQLIDQTIDEQAQLLSDIKNLSNAVTFIERKIEEEGLDFNPDNYMKLLDYRTQALYNFQISRIGVNFDGFVWPVDTGRGVSAYYHDPRYVGIFGVQHNAVDVPVYQGSIVRAAADGVVYTAKDNGYGYSYIILAHANGFMTVYGHMSNILVDEGLTIAKGSVIGLSGGMPGTKGAGYMTTGPHLHFEILLNGLHVDPLNHMPLETFTKDQIEDLPDKYFDDWEDAVMKNSFEKLLR